MVSIEFIDISKGFAGTKVIDNLNFRIEKGELVALLGPSGCGKTTILKLLAGLLLPDQGDIFFDGRSVIDLPTEKRKAVMVFQDYLLFPHLNVRDNVGFGLKMKGVPAKERELEVKKLLELVGLEGYEEYYPSQLSGGQKQRIALARALAIKPEVLLLDEPLSNLDTNLREEIRELIKKLHRDRGMTTIFVTHDREEAMLVADKIALINQGKIEQYGSPEELYRRPVSRYVADFFGRANYIPALIKDKSLYLDNNRVKLSAFQENKRVVVMIRPEFFEIAGPSAATDIDDKRDCREYCFFPGVISKLRFGGERVFYQVQTKKRCLDVIGLPHFTFQLGERVELRVKWENICILEEENG